MKIETPNSYPMMDAEISTQQTPISIEPAICLEMMDAETQISSPMMDAEISTQQIPISIELAMR